MSRGAARKSACATVCPTTRAGMNEIAAAGKGLLERAELDFVEF